LLFSVLMVILLIQAFPQVDLQAVAFHGRTAPLMIHAQACRARALRMSGAALGFGFPEVRQESHHDHSAMFAPDLGGVVASLHSTLRC